ncbi:MAG TPA: membrane protein insertase YidC [Longimicrobiales bacterium]|nr:membrane protein insertase YidC [Longimicrobiales bacterium]
MDSGRFLLAVILMIAVMVVTNLLLPPERPPLVEAPAADTAAVPVTAPSDVPADTPGIAERTEAPAPATDAPAAALPVADATVPADTIVAASPRYEYRISTRGAAVVGARLLQYDVLHEDREGERVELSHEDLPGLFSYRLRIGTREIPLDGLTFATDSDTFAVAEGEARTLELAHGGDDGPAVSVAYTFDPDRYTVGVRMAVTGLGDQTPTLVIGLPRRLAMNEALPQEDERALAYVVNSEREGISSVRLGSVRAQRIENGPLLWAAVKNKYFVTAVITHPESQSRFGGLIADPLPDDHAAGMSVTLLPDASGTFAFRLYMGPQEPQRLAEVGSNFEDVNPFGWRAFRPVLRPLGHAIQWALYGLQDLLGVGYGWVLVLFGILIRIAMWPLNAKAMRSQMKNMEIQPKLKEVQAKYKNDPEKLQKEMLRLYKEEGFNPMGGCLPMLFPLPILITLFFVFQSTIAFRGVGFLWLPDLSRADPLYILPVLLGVSMFLMQWLSTRSMTEQNPQMKFMMYAMPIFMTVIFLNFASGLNLYYASMNFASIPQQLQIMRERKKFQASRGD